MQGTKERLLMAIKIIYSFLNLRIRFNTIIFDQKIEK